LSLSKQRRRRNNQNPQDQQPVHKFPRDPQVTIPQKTEESSKCHGKQVFELMAAGHFRISRIGHFRPYGWADLS
jgi:hypothetical protein